MPFLAASASLAKGFGHPINSGVIQRIIRQLNVLPFTPTRFSAGLIWRRLTAWFIEVPNLIYLPIRLRFSSLKWSPRPFLLRNTAAKISAVSNQPLVWCATLTTSPCLVCHSCPCLPTFADFVKGPLNPFSRVLQTPPHGGRPCGLLIAATYLRR